ncbi:MAG: cytochrome c biogenesis protein CcsA [Acidobacteriota bacterium]
MDSLLFNAAFAFYAVGVFHSIAAFATRKDSLFRIAIISHGVGFICHSVFLVVLGIDRQHFPIMNLRESLFFFAWAVSLCFQISYWRYRFRALGLFSLPLVTILMLGTAFLKSYPAPEILQSSWIYLHTTCLILAYGMFFITFISSVLYLFQQRQIKSRKPRLLLERLPALLTMDEAFKKFLIAGFCFMTVGLLAGVLWAEKEWTQGWYQDPKVISTFVTWLIYLALLYMRLSVGWRGKKAALMSLFGFLSVLFTFLGARLFSGGLHTF